MRVVTHRCDFCYAKRPEKEMSKLQIPLTEEDKTLRKRTRQTLAEDKTVFHPIYGLLRAEEPTTTTMDMCAECTRGILACRFREVRRMLIQTEE